MSVEWTTASCMYLAKFAHQGQQDKAGHPYEEHVSRVGLQAVVLYEEGYLSGNADQSTLRLSLEGDIDWETARLVKMAGYLHDVVEDGRLRMAMLYDLGAPERLLHALELLTMKRTRRQVYIAGIVEDPDPIAWFVKWADNWDNSNHRRLRDVERMHGRAVRERLDTKYVRDREWLGVRRHRAVGGVWGAEAVIV